MFSARVVGVCICICLRNSDEDDESLGAPAAATYKTHSTGIFDVLEDLKEKAEAQLSELRKEMFFM